VVKMIILCTRYARLAVLLSLAVAVGLAEDLRVVGVATDPSGASIEQASVELSGERGLWRITTESNGTFAFDPVDPGSYFLSVSAPDFEPCIREVTLSDMPIEIEVVATEMLVGSTDPADNASQAAVKEGRIREDLYFRLNAVPISLPPLRDRLEDIPELSEALLRKISVRLGTPATAVTEDALRVLRGRTWPGNVRELQHALERAAILSQGAPIAPEHLASAESGFQPDPFDAIPLDAGFHSIVRSLERSLIERALAESNGNRTDAAARLGISRRLLYDKLKQLDLG
jgi:hypothetical protein